MKRVVIRKGWWRNTLRVEAGAIPAVTPDTCLIDVHAAGINFADTIVLKGYYEAANNRYPLTPGFEF
ncbi:MAG: zinc-binding dehydrogenase, partial [Alphaproteobacteria bacterium]